MTPEYCPNCGAEVPENAKACPECGSDENTGWSSDAHAERLGLPDEDFDYNEFVEREFGGKRQATHGMRWFWWVAAVLVLAAFVLLVIR
jgi:uncharacterized membrane protein YvbJ